jgi:lipopolysaccharide export system protein LptC
MNAGKQASFLFAALLFIGASGWYFVSSTPKFKLNAESLLTTTDIMITDVQVHQYSKSGNLVNTLKSPLVHHTPKDNAYWIRLPHIHVIQENQGAWEIQSQHAVALYGGEKITFTEQVRIHQPATQYNDESTFTTDEITYFPKKKQATTTQDVFFSQPGHQVQAKGLIADLEKKHIQLLSNARGSYDPNQD